MRSLAVLACCGLLLACTSTSSPGTSTEPPFPAALYIDSRGGPPMVIKAGMVELASVACDGGAVVAAGDPGVPPLPWALSVVKDSDGTVLFAGTITDLPKWLVFFGEQGSISPFPVAGPPGPPCGGVPTSAVKPSFSVAPLASGEIALPTERPVSLEPGVATACAGVGLGALLHGDASDARATWLVDTSNGTRIDVVWPPGYRARFAPDLEVLDASGVVVLRAGDAVTGGCGTVDAGILLLEPPFN